MRFFKSNAEAEVRWKVDDVVAALRRRYDSVDKASHEDMDGALQWYSVRFNNLKFAIGFMQTGPGSGEILEIGLLAVFQGFQPGPDFVAEVNRLLHISILSEEGNGQMFLLFSIGMKGNYDDKLFNGILSSWERDLMLAIQKLNGADKSFSALFPMAQSEIAQRLALNTNPRTDENPDIDLVGSFLGAKATAKSLCGSCDGRGKRGFLARECEVCDGSGFVQAR